MKYNLLNTFLKYISPEHRHAVFIQIEAMHGLSARNRIGGGDRPRDSLTQMNTGPERDLLSLLQRPREITIVSERKFLVRSAVLDFNRR
jgi:hypothetical protein